MLIPFAVEGSRIDFLNTTEMLVKIVPVVSSTINLDIWIYLQEILPNYDLFSFQIM
jgi:hypothetical protein